MSIQHFVASFFSIAIIAVSTGISSLLFQAQYGDAQINEYTQNLILKEQQYAKFYSDTPAVANKPQTTQSAVETPQSKTKDTAPQVEVSTGTNSDSMISLLSFKSPQGWIQDINSYSLPTQEPAFEYDITYTNAQNTQVTMSLTPRLNENSCVENLPTELFSSTPISPTVKRFKVGNLVQYIPVNFQDVNCRQKIYYVYGLGEYPYVLKMSATLKGADRMEITDDVVKHFLTNVDSISIKQA